MVLGRPGSRPGLGAQHLLPKRIMTDASYDKKFGKMIKKWDGMITLYQVKPAFIDRTGGAVNFAQC
jgi:hypothetical protein